MDNGSIMGIRWLFIDHELESFDRLYRLVYPVPKGLGMSDDIWFQVEHQDRQLMHQHWPASKWQVHEKGEVTDPDAVAVLERKAAEGGWIGLV